MQQYHLLSMISKRKDPDLLLLSERRQPPQCVPRTGQGQRAPRALRTRCPSPPTRSCQCWPAEAPVDPCQKRSRSPCRWQALLQPCPARSGRSDQPRLSTSPGRGTSWCRSWNGRQASHLPQDESTRFPPSSLRSISRPPLRGPSVQLAAEEEY